MKIKIMYISVCYLIGGVNNSGYAVRKAPEAFVFTLLGLPRIPCAP